MTEWGDSGLPEKFQHPDIAYYRLRVLDHHEAYQIGFGQLFMPLDYRIPDGYEIIGSRVESFHPSHRPRWKRLLLPRSHTSSSWYGRSTTESTLSREL